MKFDTEIAGRSGKLTVEDGHFHYEPEGSAGIERAFSIEALDSGAWSVLVEGRSYAVTMGPAGEVRVNNNVFSVEVFDPRAMRPQKKSGVGQGRQSMAALMPGKVVRILVTPGDTVEPGQGLVVVEAMKMQNEMKSPRAGRIAEIRTSPGATVAAGEILIVIE
jgi:biotin carboxyl carrier protein